MDDPILTKIVEDQGRRIEALEERMKKLEEFVQNRGWMKDD